MFLSLLIYSNYGVNYLARRATRLKANGYIGRPLSEVRLSKTAYITEKGPSPTQPVCRTGNVKLREMFFCHLGYILCELAFRTDCWGPFKHAYRAGCWCYGKADTFR